MIGQTLIPVSADNELTFASFIVGENAALIQELHSLITFLTRGATAVGNPPGLSYLWSESGAGKTHLIHALCDEGRTQGVECQFLSLAESNIASYLENQPAAPTLVCIDNLPVICGSKDLEIAFLSFYERVRAAGGLLVAAARKPPRESGFALPDLVSRLQSGAIWQVMPMLDEDKKIALQKRAQVRGFILNDQVIDFVMSHFARDTVSLFALLDQLDRASLAHQRKVTVPFIKEVIGA